MKVKNKTKKLNYFASICFLIVSIMQFIDKKYILAILFLMLTIVYFILGRQKFKKK